MIVFQGGFHGRTVAAATMTTSGTRFRAGFGPLMGGVHVAPFPYAFRYGWDEEDRHDVRAARARLPASQTRLRAERDGRVLRRAGARRGRLRARPTPSSSPGLRERADRHGILLVIDEVQTGFGRTGKFWGHEHFGVTPDVVIIAKGLASGFPLSGIAASQELMAKAWPGSQGGTYGGNAVSCAAAVATLDVIREGRPRGQRRRTRASSCSKVRG